MKDALKKFGQCLLVILLLPILLLFLLGFLIYTPYDFIKYLRSPYYKDTRRKYRWLFASSNCFKLYNAIKKSSLPIEYVEDPENFYGMGYFFYRDTLILYDEIPSYDDETGAWTVSRENDHEEDIGVNIEDVIRDEIESCNSLIGEDKLTKGILLFDKSRQEESDIEHLGECELIFAYEDNVEVGLKSLIERLDC